MKPENIHCFEQAGLGKAPFRFVGVESQGHLLWPRRRQHRRGAHHHEAGRLVRLLREPTSSICSASSRPDGKRFRVGCECVAWKTDDSGLIRKVDEAIRQMNRRRRMENKIAKEAADKALCQAVMLHKLATLASKPHPQPNRQPRRDSAPLRAMDVREPLFHQSRQFVPAGRRPESRVSHVHSKKRTAGFAKSSWSSGSKEINRRGGTTVPICPDTGLPGMSGRELRKLMRQYRVTIRELAQRTGNSMKTIRRLCREGTSFLGSLDYWQAITGSPQLDPRRRAMLRQYQSRREANERLEVCYDR